MGWNYGAGSRVPGSTPRYVCVEFHIISVFVWLSSKIKKRAVGGLVMQKCPSG